MAHEGNGKLIYFNFKIGECPTGELKYDVHINLHLHALYFSNLN